MARWCREVGVGWTELPQTGVVRRLRTRQGWAGRWQARMDAPPLPPPPPRVGIGLGDGGAPAGMSPEHAWAGLHHAAGPHRPLPTAGEAAGHATLQDFLQHRGQRYRQELSSPLTAPRGCSRLSAPLAFGTLSMRQVHQATEQQIARLRALPDAQAHAHAYHLRGFSSRLRWHCHFMQKLEDEPELEWRCLARSTEGLRPAVPDHDRLQAWCAGQTGFPMVDACMRSLNTTGWLNFRMRAMLVSFAAYHLWLHWREPGLHLARQFLDFEPGIHWSQMQMQSGTTGINTLRIYSPARQAAEHDPHGAFVRRWVPELGSARYPAPIVDERAALAHAKATLYGLRGTRQAREEADAIQQRHGSRKSGLPPSGRGQRAGPSPSAPRAPRRPAAPAGQGDLFADDADFPPR